MTDNLPVSNDREIVAKFKPRARLLLQLGDQLIKNESIALSELAKNAYDADASLVSIDMYHPDSIEDGYIVIEDDGFGMTADIVEDLLHERVGVEVVRGNAQQVAFHGVVEGDVGRPDVWLGDFHVVFFDHFHEDSRDFVVHANPGHVVAVFRLEF